MLHDEISPLFGLSQRFPPSNVQAEQALLGAILANNKALDRCHGLETEHFADPIHGRIFETVRKLVDAGHVADAVTLKTTFEHAGVLDDVGGTVYLTQSLTAMVGIINAGDYARAIRDCWLRRQLIEVGEVAVNLAFGADPDVDGEAAVTATMEHLLTLGERSGAADGTDFATAARGAFERSEAAHRSAPGFARLDTGIASVDRIWGGLWPGQFYILMARSNTGKTPAMMQIARHVARGLLDEAATTKQPPGHVHVWSLEMTANDLLTVNLASETRWTADQIRAGDIGGDADWLEFERASRELGRLPILIDDNAETDMPTLARRTRAVKRQKRTRLVCIDFRELIRRGHDQARMPLQEWMPYLCYQLKALAKAANVPVIALAQINKSNDGTDLLFPTIGHLPYGGEQAADAVFALHRKELYMPVEMPAPPRTMAAEKVANLQSAWAQERKTVAGLAEFGSVKRRFGPKGNTKLYFDGPRMLLSEWQEATPQHDFWAGSDIE